MTTNVNIAVIGCGYWGPNLIRNFNNATNCTLKTLCDANQKRLDAMKALYPQTQTVLDYQQVLNDQDIQAVVIALPVHLHYPIAKAALEIGKHVLVEKPMTSSVEQSKELVALAKQKNLTLMVGHTFIYSAPVRTIKEIVKSGELGDLIYMSSRRLNLGLFQKDINVTWDLAPHDLAIMLYILGSDAESVNCTGVDAAKISEKIEAITSLSVKFKNGVFANIQSSWLDPNKVREMTFVGTKKMLVFNDVEQFEKIKIYDKGIDVPDAGYSTFADFVFAYRNGDMYSPSLKMVEPLKLEAQHFIDCILSGQTPETSGEDGLKVVQILEASSSSLQQHGAQIVLQN
jgi:predicted dehydrogenase